MSDDRQELQQEQECEIITTLKVVSQGMAGYNEAALLAAHLGLSKEFKKDTKWVA